MTVNRVLMAIALFILGIMILGIQKNISTLNGQFAEGKGQLTKELASINKDIIGNADMLDQIVKQTKPAPKPAHRPVKRYLKAKPCPISTVPPPNDPFGWLKAPVPRSDNTMPRC